MLYHYTLIKLRCFILAFSTRSENERPLISHASVGRIKIREEKRTVYMYVGRRVLTPFYID